MDALSPPPISFSAPELSSRCVLPFKALRNAVSSSQLLHEFAMARFRKAIAMKEEQTKIKNESTNGTIDIPYNTFYDQSEKNQNGDTTKATDDIIKARSPEIFIKSDSIDKKEYKYNSRQASQDSETSENRWQQMSFDEDYTASTVSSEGEYSDEGSFNEDLNRSNYSNEEETYNPRDKMARPSPLKESHEEIEEEELSEREPLKPLKLPDPNFVPKPILKRRESDMIENKQTLEVNTLKINQKPKSPKLKQKSKTDEKLTIFKKITTMPIQKSFQLPRLNKNKKESEKTEASLPIDNSKLNNKTEKVSDKVTEEGRTVIDYYTNIVKEYGSQKKTNTPIYLKTEDLKAVAEQQLEMKNENTAKNEVFKSKKQISKTTDIKQGSVKLKTNSIDKSIKIKSSPNCDKNTLLKKTKAVNATRPKTPDNQIKAEKKCTQQVILRKAERATIVIPINYQELEAKAKVNVRSVIDYTVDVCLLLLAFWVYFFRDERLAIPFLILIIYRQLQETLQQNIPDWYNRHTPNWLKKKTS